MILHNWVPLGTWRFGLGVFLGALPTTYHLPPTTYHIPPTTYYLLLLLLPPLPSLLALLPLTNTYYLSTIDGELQYEQTNNETQSWNHDI